MSAEIPVIDPGDTAWMLDLDRLLVLMMTKVPGLALFLQRHGARKMRARSTW